MQKNCERFITRLSSSFFGQHSVNTRLDRYQHRGLRGEVVTDKFLLANEVDGVGVIFLEEAHERRLVLDLVEAAKRARPSFMTNVQRAALGLS